jgi:hypothetical protein
VYAVRAVTSLQHLYTSWLILLPSMAQQADLGPGPGPPHLAAGLLWTNDKLVARQPAGCPPREFQPFLIRPLAIILAVLNPRPLGPEVSTQPLDH